MESLYEVIIIGSGPAGMTAALYASRAGAKTLIVEAMAPGGKMIKTHLVENYPAYVSINGTDLSMKMSEHSLAFGAVYEYGNVIEVKPYQEKYFEVVCEHGVSFYGKSVIVATGTVERKIGLAKEEELLGKGVSYCAVCDGAFFKNEEVIVIGGGNSALDESLYLTQFVKKVTVIIRRDVFRAEPTTVEQVMKNDKIEVIVKHVPVEIMEQDGKVSGLKIRHVETGEEQIVSGKGLFPYIGSDPVTQFLKPLAVLDEQGYVVVNEHQATEIAGLYAAGDVVKKELRQIVTATSDGAIAAQSVLKYLKG